MNNGNHQFDMKEYLPSHLIPFIHSQGFIDADLDGDLDIVVIEDKFFNASSSVNIILENSFPNSSEGFSMT